MAGKNETRDLACFLWYEIQGKEKDAFSDPLFIRRYMGNAKKFINSKADIDTAKLAMKMMKDAGVDVYSPQQTMSFTARGGMSYYEKAQAELERRNIPPPEWDIVPYQEYLLRKKRMVA